MSSQRVGSRKRVLDDVEADLELESSTDKDTIEHLPDPLPHSTLADKHTNDDDDDNEFLGKGRVKKIKSEPVIEPKTKTDNKKDSMAKVMQNSLITAKIAKKLPANYLLNLRRTCTSWNSSFIPELKKTHSTIRLSNQSSAYPSSNLSPIKSMTNFLQLARSATNLPFSRYQFDQHECRGAADETERESFRSFITEFGHTIKSLQLSWQDPNDFPAPASQLRHLIFKQTPELTELILTPSAKLVDQAKEEERMLLPLPNLKRLIVCVRQEQEEEDDGPFTQLICDAIQSAPGLETLDLSEVPYGFDVWFVYEVLTGLLRNYPPPPPLSASHLHKLKSFGTSEFELSDESLQLLLKLAERQEGDALRLESFVTYVGCRTDDEVNEAVSVNAEYFQLFKKFWNTQAPTLKNFELEFDHDNEDEFNVFTPCRIPRLEALKKLKIVRCSLEEDQIQFDANANGGGAYYSFCNTFPNLEEFSLVYCSCTRLEDVGRRFYHSGVKTFALDTNQIPGIDYKSFANFRHCFPGLTRLELTLGADFSFEEEDDQLGRPNNSFIVVQEFDKVWTTWPQLIVVHIKCEVPNLDLDLDSFVSGVPRTRLERLRPKLPLDISAKPTLDTLDSLRAMLEKHKTRPGITDLEHLQEFVIKFDSHGPEDYHPQLTDLGGYLGAALAGANHSGRIQRLVIQAQGMNLVSEQCREFIRQVLGPLADISL